MLTLQERAEAYNSTFGVRFPDSRLHVEGRMLCGYWLVGNDYRNKSRLYGAYPPGYVDRVRCLFPDIPDLSVLHLFSGSLSTGSYITFDCQGEAEVIGDAHKLGSYFGGELPEEEAEKFELIMADPPYSRQDAGKYGTPMIKRNVVVSECYKVLKQGGFLVWLDTMLPMYRKAEFIQVGAIGLQRSTNHRFRTITIFQRQ